MRPIIVRAVANSTRCQPVLSPDGVRLRRGGDAFVANSTRCQPVLSLLVVRTCAVSGRVANSTRCQPVLSRHLGRLRVPPRRVANSTRCQPVLSLEAIDLVALLVNVANSTRCQPVLSLDTMLVLAGRQGFRLPTAHAVSRYCHDQWDYVGHDDPVVANNTRCQPVLSLVDPRGLGAVPAVANSTRCQPVLSPEFGHLVLRCIAMLPTAHAVRRYCHVAQEAALGERQRLPTAHAVSRYCHAHTDCGRSPSWRCCQQHTLSAGIVTGGGRAARPPSQAVANSTRCQPVLSRRRAFRRRGSRLRCQQHTLSAGIVT